MHDEYKEYMMNTWKETYHPHSRVFASEVDFASKHLTIDALIRGSKYLRSNKMMEASVHSVFFCIFRGKFLFY